MSYEFERKLENALFDSITQPFMDDKPMFAY